MEFWRRVERGRRLRGGRGLWGGGGLKERGRVEEGRGFEGGRRRVGKGCVNLEKGIRVGKRIKRVGRDWKKMGGEVNLGEV